ncbi:MAG: LamG domain-containing protein, partial [Thaumarchaeota archaeon]|nr:LamG domain-containing protein [Nitrososphaerota archaeon]
MNWQEPTDAGSLPIDANTVGYWRFQEGSGTTANDSTGSGNTGTLTNFACTTLDCNAASGWSSNGRKGNGIVFDGSNDYVDAGNNSVLDPINALSVSAWIKPYSPASTSYLISKGPDDAVNGQFGLVLASKFYFNIRQNSAFNQVAGTTTINQNNWYYVVGAWNGSTMRLYVNGVEEGTPYALSAPLTVNNGNLQIGWLGKSGYLYQFKGIIDEVQVWNRALTANDVNILYQKGSLKYSLLRGTVATDVNALMVTDLNSSVFSDFNAVDLNSPNVPSTPVVSGATTSSLDVNWSAVSDNGSTYYYRVKAKDFEGNDLYAWSGVDSNVVSSGVWQYWLQDLNQSNKVYGPYSGLGATVSGLSSGSQHCFQVKAQDSADNNSSLSSQACNSVLSSSISLTSSTHPTQGTWYNSANASMTAAGTFDHINYLVDNTATQPAATIISTGTYDLDGVFTVNLASSNTWYVHAVGLNDQNQGTVTANYQINYDGTAPTASSVSVSSWSGGVSGFTNDVTPPLSISASDTGGSGLYQISFSCNGSTWSSWVTYATSYESFNIRTSSGCADVESCDKNVQVKVKDTAGNVSGTVYTANFCLDQTAPTSNSIAVNSWTGQSTFTNDAAPDLTIGSTGAYQMKFSCSEPTYSTYESYASSKTDFNIKPTVSANGCATTDGSRTIYAVFKDQAGNEAASVNTGSFTLDTTAPVPSPSTPANDYNYSTPDPNLVSVSVEATSGVWKCFVRIATDVGMSNVVRMVSGSVGGDNTTCTFSGYSQLSEGTYYWDVNALDKAGNWSAYSTVWKFTRDNTAPAFPSNLCIDGDCDSDKWDKSNNSLTTLTFTAGEIGETCKWNLTSVVYAFMSNSCSRSVSELDFNCPFGNLSQTTTASQYNARYHSCIDRVGNDYNTQTISFGVDWNAPTTSDNSDTSVHAPTYNVTITESDNASNPGLDITTYYCTGSDSCNPTTAIDNGGAVSFTANSPGRGTQSLRYYCIDLAGNTQTTVTKTININQLPVWGNNPGFDSNALKDANKNGTTISCKGGKSIRFDANASDADSGQTLKFYVCSSDSATGSGCAETTACSSTGSSTNPTCTYAQLDSNSLITWYGFVFDSLNESIGTSKSTSYTCDSACAVTTLQLPANKSSSSDNTPNFAASTNETASHCYLQLSRDANFAPGSIVTG